MDPESESPVLTRTHPVEGGGIFEVILNRPEVHNAVDGPSARLLLEAWRRFQSDESLSVAIFRGTGDQAFCAGADLSALEELADPGSGPMGGTRLIQTKPIITVSQGFTYAGGLELYCHGHIRIAEPNASFSVACRRWGVPLVDGGTVYLPRLLGWGAALPLLITGQRINAERAYQIGLVWELVGRGEGPERAMSMARQIAQLPQDALRGDLASAMTGFHLSLGDAMALEAKNLEPVMQSESTRKGVEAFLSGKRFWFT